MCLLHNKNPWTQEPWGRSRSILAAITPINPPGESVLPVPTALGLPPDRARISCKCCPDTLGSLCQGDSRRGEVSPCRHQGLCWTLGCVPSLFPSVECGLTCWEHLWQVAFSCLSLQGSPQVQTGGLLRVTLSPSVAHIQDCKGLANPGQR